MDPRLLDLLVCPLCKGKLRHDRANAELVCRVDRLAFPIRDGIPQMLVDNARTLSDAPAETATATQPAASVQPADTSSTNSGDAPKS